MSEQKHSSFGGFIDGYKQGLFRDNQDLIFGNLEQSMSMLRVIAGEYQGEDFAGKDASTFRLDECKKAIQIDINHPIESIARYARALVTAIAAYRKSGSQRMEQVLPIYHELAYNYIEIARTLEDEHLMDAAIAIDEVLS